MPSGGHNKKLEKNKHLKEIIKMRKNGMSYEQIAKKYRVAGSTVQAFLKTHNSNFTVNFHSKERAKKLLKDYMRYGLMTTAILHKSTQEIIKFQIDNILYYLRPASFKVAITREVTLNAFMTKATLLGYKIPEDIKMPKYDHIYLGFGKDGIIYKGFKKCYNYPQPSAPTALQRLSDSIEGIEEELCRLKIES